MNTREIIANFMKGSSKVSISAKQRMWLMSTAKREGFAIGFDGSQDTIYFDDCMYQIRNCKRMASGGSYVGSEVIEGRYVIEILYTIRFTEGAKCTEVCRQSYLDHIVSEGFSFEIIQPTINTSTR
jgi:hypothetical protein